LLYYESTLDYEGTLAVTLSVVEPRLRILAAKRPPRWPGWLRGKAAPRPQADLEAVCITAALTCRQLAPHALAMNAAELQKLTEWLVDGARSAPSPPRMMAETCERLVAAGLPLWRVGIFVRTLHPDIIGRNFVWKPGEEVVVGTANYDMVDSPEFLNSPLAIVFREGREVRALIDSPDARRFPFLDDMRAEGVTDYIALPLLHVDGSFHASSWTTRQPGGFTDEQLDALRALMPPLARLIEIIRLRRTASIPMSATAPASAFSAGRFAAGTPIRWKRRSGCRTCAASPRCRTACRRRPWSIFLIYISTARYRLSGRMAGRCSSSWATGFSRCFRSMSMSAM
jgi:hypothetical protein